MGATKANSGPQKASTKPEMTGSDGFAHLSPHIRHISQSTIRKKWRPLPQSSQDRVRAILLSLKTRRAGANDPGRVPTMASVKGRGQGPTKKQHRSTRTKKQEADDEYQAAVEMVTEKLLGRIPRMPFPPSSTSNASGNSTTHTDESFCLEATLHRTSTLESLLSMHTSTSHLLRAQMKREKRALRRDRAELEALQAGLKSETRLRKVQERGLHPVVRVLDDPMDDAVVQVQQDQDQAKDRTDISTPGADGSQRPSGNAGGIDDEDGSGDDSETAQGFKQSSSVTSRPRPPTTALKPSHQQQQHRIRLAQSLPLPSHMTLNHHLDPDMRNLVTRLRSHLTSMQTNTDGMRPVLQAMDKTKVALDQFVAARFAAKDRDRVYGMHD